MSLPSLVLWLLVFPLALIPGVVAGLVTYLVARPRLVDVPGAVGVRRELLVEGWRLVAIVAGVPAAILVMELVVWGLFFQQRVPLAYTGAAQWLGLLLLALVPAPLVAAVVHGQPAWGRPAALAVALMVVGGLLFPVGWVARTTTWRGLVTRLDSDPAALREVIVLKGYRFITEQEAASALDRALPATSDVLVLANRVGQPDGPVLDSDITAYLAARLERALVAADPAVTTEPELAAVPAMWRLTADYQRTLRAYALAVPELRGAALAHRDPDFQRVTVDALRRGAEPVAATLLAAIADPAAQVPLRPDLITALAERVGTEPPVGPLAEGLLLRDASAAALRPIMPRLANSSDPLWAVVRAECISRTAGLVALSEDRDTRVAAGARAVLAYVRQYCVTTRRVGQ